MEEMSLVHLSLLGGLFVIVASWLYAWGGRSNKWIRRFAGSFVASLGSWVVAIIAGVFHGWFLLAWPALSIAFHMGYGADTINMKIIRRTIYAIFVLCAGLVFVLSIGATNAWILFICQAICAVSSVVLGVKNPEPAAVEEFLVCMVLTLFFPFYPLVQLV